jgi:lipopolysaccharide biosynthesis glycosyltransferase
MDVGMQCNINRKDDETKDTIINVLNMDNPSEYLQAGLMLLNLTELRNTDFTQKCLECLQRVKTPRFVDQDIINSVVYKKVKWLDTAWNVEWHLPFSIRLYERLLPEKIYLKYLEDRQDPAMIHYAGPKPWNVFDQEFSDVWWSFARETACYEAILNKLWRNDVNQSVELVNKQIVSITHKKNLRKFFLTLKLYMWKIITTISFGKVRAYSWQKKNKQKEKLRNLKGLQNA